MPKIDDNKPVFSVEVSVSYAKHSNIIPANLARLAKDNNVVHDGGGMWMGQGRDPQYDHIFFTNSRDDAQAFSKKAKKAGFKASIMTTGLSLDTFNKLMDLLVKAGKITKRGHVYYAVKS